MKFMIIGFLSAVASHASLAATLSCNDSDLNRFISARIDSEQSVASFYATDTSSGTMKEYNFEEPSLTPSAINTPLGGFSLAGRTSDGVSGVLSVHPIDESRTSELFGFFAKVDADGVNTVSVACRLQ